MTEQPPDPMSDAYLAGSLPDFQHGPGDWFAKTGIDGRTHPSGNPGPRPAGIPATRPGRPGTTHKELHQLIHALAQLFEET